MSDHSSPPLPIPFRVLLTALLSLFCGVRTLAFLLHADWFFGLALPLLPLGIGLLYGYPAAVRWAKVGIILSSLAVVAMFLLTGLLLHMTNMRGLLGWSAAAITLGLLALKLLFRQFDSSVWLDFIYDREALRKEHQRVPIPWMMVCLVGLAGISGGGAPSAESSPGRSRRFRSRGV